MKRILLIFFILCQLSAHAQLKYCRGTQEFRADEWITLDKPIEVDQRSKSQKWWWGGSEFKFTTGDKKIDKMLKNEAFVIMYEDSLYINCKRLKSSESISKRPFGVGYTKAFRFNEDNLLVVYPPVSSTNGVLGMTVLFGALAGAVTAAVAVNNALDNMVCYFVRTSYLADSKYVKVLRVDTELMENLLADDPELLKDYKSVEKKKVREGATNTLDIFERKGWIKK